MDDSAIYTGVDGVEDGIFGNEAPTDEVKQLQDEQKKQLQELTPKLENILKMLEGERNIAISYIADYVDSVKDDDTILRGELIAAARYRKYIDGLMTKFTLELQETKK